MRRQWANITAILFGAFLGVLIMFWGLPVPKTMLFDIESLVFWLPVGLALLVAVFQLLRRFLGAYCTLWCAPTGLNVPDHRRAVLSLDALALVGAFIVFSIPVSSLWFTGKTTYFHVGGFLPWSDPAGYQFGGLHLLHEGFLDWWSTRRPLNAGFMATRLALVDEDLQLSLVLQTLVAALACFLAAREVGRSHGTASGLLMFALLYEFARPFLGTPMSESLGLSFGCLGFAVLWGASQHAPRGPLLAVGVMLLTLGLNARAGAFFILPALLVWAFLAFRGSRPSCWRVSAWGLAGICAGFLLNAALLWVFGTGEGMPHANFALTLYGLAVGGKGYARTYLDHPEVKAMIEAGNAHAVAEYVYTLAMQAIWSDPKPFIAAYLDGLRFYWDNFFRFIEELPSYGHEGSLKDAALIPVLQVLSVLALFLLLVRRRDRRLHQLALVVLGIFASAPFLIRDGGYRLLAATMPYIAAMPAVGASFLTGIGAADSGAAGLSAPPSRSPETAPRLPLAAVIVGGVLTFSAVVGPALAVAFHDRLKFDPPACGRGLHSVIFRLGYGSAFLKVLPLSQADGRTRIPEIRFDDFQADPKFGGIEIAPVFRKVRPSTWIIRAYDLQEGFREYGLPAGLREYSRGVWLIADDRMNLPPPGEYVHICGQRDEDAVSPYIVLHVKSAERIELRRTPE